MSFARLAATCARGTVGTLIALIFLTPPCLFSQDVEEQIRNHYQSAQKATREGRYGEAEGEYLAILILNPALAEAHANLGFVYYVTLKYERAAETFKKALEIHPNLARARLYLGLAQFHLNNYENSVRSLQRALTDGLEPPYRKLARINLARDYLALGQTETGIEILRSLSEMFPDDTDVLYTLGKSYLRLAASAAEKLASIGDNSRARQMKAEALADQGKFKDAIDEYRIALSLDPENPDIHYLLGVLLLHQGLLDGGRRHLATVVEANPKNERARELLELSRKGLPPSAALEEALTGFAQESGRLLTGFFDPPDGVLVEKSHRGQLTPLEEARRLFRSGKQEAAAKILRGLTSRDPRNLDALYWLVKCYHTLSVRNFELIARVGPDSARAHQLLAEGLVKQERTEEMEEAVKEYDEVLKRNPHLPGIHYAKGMALLRMTNWGEARKAFQNELSVDPRNAGAYQRLGELAYRAAQYDEALRYFARAVELYPEFGEAHLGISRILARKRQYQKSLPHLLAAEKFLPDDHTVHFLLYRAYRNLGKTELAQKELKIFQRMEREKKQATERKAARTMERLQKARQNEAARVR